MKKIFMITVFFSIIISLCACTRDNNNDNIAESKASVTQEMGTHSNPYSFNDDLKIISNSGNEEYNVEYNIKLNELWDSQKVASTYSSYKMNDRVLIRAEISVACEESDDKINFDLHPVFITETMNEESASVYI